MAGPFCTGPTTQPWGQAVGKLNNQGCTYPDNWGNSGVMTFIINQQGRVYLSDQRVAGNHVAVDDVAVFSARCMRALASEDLKVVTVIGRAIDLGNVLV